MTEEKFQEALNGRDWDKGTLMDTLAPYMPPESDEQQDGINATLLAAHKLIAHTPSLLAGVSLDDALGSVEQQNLPGVIEGHPNWRRKYTHTVEAIKDGTAVWITSYTRRGR